MTILSGLQFAYDGRDLLYTNKIYLLPQFFYLIYNYYVLKINMGVTIS